MIANSIIRTSRVGLSPSLNRAAIVKTLATAYQHRELLKEMILRSLHAAHARHGFGGAWIYLQPLIIVSTYLLIFGFVLGSRIQNGNNFPGDYPSYILIGLVPWLMMQAALIRSSTALLSNGNLVKQIVFPIEILPVAAVAASAIPYIPAFLLVIVYKAVVSGGLPWTVCLLPVVLLLLASLAMGLAFALSGLTAFVRDVGEVVQSFCSVALYLMPIVYLPGWVPHALRPLVYIIPFSYPAWVMQDVLFFGYIAHPISWLITTIFAVGSLALGFRLFEKLKPYYGNVL